MELENLHFTSIRVIIDSGKNHQWMLKPLVKFVLKQDIYTDSNHFLSDNSFILYREKGIFTMKKPGRHHLNQVIKVKITNKTI